MDLDTKLKSSNSQRLVRALTVVIAIIAIVIGVFNGITIVSSASVLGPAVLDKNATLYDCPDFQREIRNDVSNIIAWSNRDYNEKQIKKAQQSCVDSVLAGYVYAKDFYDSNYQEINKYYTYGEDYGPYNYVIDRMEALHINDRYNEYGVHEFYYSYDFSYNFPDGRYFYFSFELPLSYSKEEAQTEIEKKFYNLAKERSYEYYQEPNVPEIVSFYVESKDGVVYTNVKDLNVLKQSINAHNGFSLTDSDLSENKLYDICKDTDTFYTGNTKQAYFLLTDNYKAGSKYALINNRFDSVSHDISKNITLCLVCIAVMIAMLVVSCCMAGRRQAEYSNISIDKMPNDLHFLLNGGLVAGGLYLGLIAVYLYINIVVYNDNSSYHRLLTMLAGSRWYVPVICALACGIYLLFCEWLTSVARQVKTHSKFFKNTIVYMLARLGVRLFKTIIVKPAKKGIGLIKYRPVAFKKQLIGFLIGYGLVNVLLLFFVAVCDATGPRLLLALIWFCINAASLVFVVKYVVSLDEIIRAYNERRPPRVNFNTLPQSLKMLVYAQRYTSEELNRAVEKAIKDERMRSELITNVSHDLKTPLTSIISYVNLLKDCNIEDERAREYIAVLDEKGSRLKRLIDDLVEASKITSGVITLNLVQLDLGELATQAVVEHQQEFADNGLELIFKGDKKSLTAVADGTKTFRVIENLMSNARKYSAKGSRVYADVYEQDNTAVFEIKNVSAQKLDISANELKERFVRGDKSRNQEGNGLGLSIADSLCKAMHGNMEITIDGDLFKVKVILPKQ